MYQTWVILAIRGAVKSEIWRRGRILSAHPRLLNHGALAGPNVRGAAHPRSCGDNGRKCGVHHANLCRTTENVSCSLLYNQCSSSYVWMICLTGSLRLIQFLSYIIFIILKAIYFVWFIYDYLKMITKLLHHNIGISVRS